VLAGFALAAYPTARPVLNGEDEETGRQVLRLVLTQLECDKFFGLRTHKGHVDYGLTDIEIIYEKRR